MARALWSHLIMSEIYNIIDKKKLDVVTKPISKAHGLPNECYTSKDYTSIERKNFLKINGLRLVLQVHFQT